MEQETVKIVTDYLDKIAAKIGTTVEHIWPWLVRQEYVEPLYALFVAVILGFFTYIMASFISKHWDPKDKDGYRDKSKYSITHEDHEVLWAAPCFILFSIAVVSFCAFLFEFGDVFNPEYHALMKLINMAK